MDKGKAINSAKAYLEGLKNRPKQPWDELADDMEKAREARSAPPPPPAPSKPQPADDPMGQAERIAARNRMFDKKTRYLRRD